MNCEMQAEQSDVSATYTANLTIAALVASSAVAFSTVHRAQVPMPLILVVLLAGFAALMYRHRSCSLLIVVFGTALIDFNSRVTLLGDDSWLRIASSAEKTLWASSAGGNAVLRAIVQNGMDAAFLAPICGVLTAGALSWRAVIHADVLERSWGLVVAVLAGTLPTLLKRLSRGHPNWVPSGSYRACAGGGPSFRTRIEHAEDRSSHPRRLRSVHAWRLSTRGGTSRAPGGNEDFWMDEVAAHRVRVSHSGNDRDFSCGDDVHRWFQVCCRQLKRRRRRENSSRGCA